MFAAGADYFGVSDLSGFVDDTHKFESRYNDWLVGPWPEAADLWRARSPINHADKIRAPVIVLQGLEDKVVPPSQSEVIVAALERNGIPHEYIGFEGEQHGFRKAENLQRAAEAELAFYVRVTARPMSPRRGLTSLDRMTKIYTGASVSLDGYISGPGETGFEHLFKWYGNGDVEYTMGGMTLQMTEGNMRHVRMLGEMTGALIVGRKLFDYTSGWSGKHPLGVHTVVASHSVPEGWEREGEWFTFVDSIEAAVEAAAKHAGEKVVGANGGEIASQLLAKGLLDEVWLDLVPVILGDGTPFFSGVSTAALEGPISVDAQLDVTHLRYRVNRGG